MSGITTHVLDTASGRPAAGVLVTLAIHNGEWRTVGRGMTDADGRLRSLTEGVALQPNATYRLTFATGDYNHGFFPEVSVVFRVDDPLGHYHVPLLLSPYGYSTYRGT